jgi:hypothetical protein
MLIILLLALGVAFLQNTINLLEEVLDPFNKFGFSVFLSLSMRGLFLCNAIGRATSYVNCSYVNWGQWKECKAPLKRVMTNRTMKQSVETFIQCTWILGIVHSEDMHNHIVDYLCLSIMLGVEDN